MGVWPAGCRETPRWAISPASFFIEVFGDGRCVQLYDRFKQATFSDGTESWTQQRDDEEGFQLENQEFIAALREGRDPELNAHDGLQATRIVLAADAAIRSGCRVEAHFGR